MGSGVSPSTGATFTWLPRHHLEANTLTPEQFDTIHAALPSPRWQAMIELDMESALRWGGITDCACAT